MRTRPPRRFQVPKSPPVACVEALRGADSVNRADPLADRNGAVGTDQRLDLLLCIAKERARHNHSAFGQTKGTRGASRAVIKGASEDVGSGVMLAMRFCAAAA